MDKPLVSICCITYNHAPFIRKCLDGFLMQKAPLCVQKDAKMSDWCEILIHDDCSTDGTTDIVKEYAAKYPDLIFPLYEKENQYSRGKAGKIDLYNYERAKGKYIAYCEGDDYWTEPLKLQKQVDFLESHPYYSVTFHRCKHVNVSNNSEKEDDCGFLFTNNEVGVNIDVDLFFKHWITQPLTTVCRSSMHNITLAYKYKYYRDMHEIYHLLKAGKGYIFNFVGGVRNVHSGGVASQISRERYCEISLPMDGEFYRMNKEEYGAKRTYLDTLQSSVNVYSQSHKFLALKCAFKHVFISHYYKTFFKNVKHIIFS